jgi:hypothetical protein
MPGAGEVAGSEGEIVVPVGNTSPAHIDASGQTAVVVKECIGQTRVAVTNHQVLIRRADPMRHVQQIVR